MHFVLVVGGSMLAACGSATDPGVGEEQRYAFATLDYVHIDNQSGEAITVDGKMGYQANQRGPAQVRRVPKFEIDADAKGSFTMPVRPRGMTLSTFSIHATSVTSGKRHAWVLDDTKFVDGPDNVRWVVVKKDIIIPTEHVNHARGVEVKNLSGHEVVAAVEVRYSSETPDEMLSLRPLRVAYGATGRLEFPPPHEDLWISGYSIRAVDKDGRPFQLLRAGVAQDIEFWVVTAARP
jgi:hypothetical protein